MKKTIALMLTLMLTISSAGLPQAAELTQNEAGSETNQPRYVNTLFDTSTVHKIDVIISNEDWAELLETPTEKTKYAVSVTIDDNPIDNVSFATKGNTSLTQVAGTDSDRYSFKINFGKYVDGQTYDGLDVLNLNNTFSDATYLKDYLSYRIMAETGVAAPLVSFAALSINGEYYGLYVAIEEINDSFLARNYGDNTGALYKPESSHFDRMGEAPGGERGNWGDREMPDLNGVFGADRPGLPKDSTLTMPKPEDGFTTPMPRESPTMPGGEGFAMQGRNGMGGDFGGSSNGASLVYTDDAISSYSDIFDNAKTDTNEADNQRVIDALKQLSNGDDLESCINVAAVLRYFAAHNFVMNYDSYTGNMLHNYYLYEEEGILTILPWDYNLAFGGFNNNTAVENVNWPIDSPLATGVSQEDRPLWSKLAANESYLTQYHQYFDALLTDYFESGRFEAEFDAVYARIYPYVVKDPTAFYTLEEFVAAADTLKRFTLLRSESIRGQLDGTIPATAAGQAADPSALIDADDIDIKSMGSMGPGNGGENRPGFGPDFDFNMESVNEAS